jgi:hypothetical protein
MSKKRTWLLPPELSLTLFFKPYPLGALMQISISMEIALTLLYGSNREKRESEAETGEYFH